MVINKRKKNSRMRAKTTHGLGSMKKGRGAGNRGGRGMAGTGKRADQKKPTILKLYGNTYFGKHGFNRPQKKIKKIRTINLDQLNRLIEKGLFKKEKDIYNIDLNELKYQKLLSRGKLKYKAKIKVKYVSKKVAEKLKQQGGEVVSNEITTAPSRS